MPQVPYVPLGQPLFAFIATYTDWYITDLILTQDLHSELEFGYLTTAVPTLPSPTEQELTGTQNLSQSRLASDFFSGETTYPFVPDPSESSQTTFTTTSTPSTVRLQNYIGVYEYSLTN
jgi:hypothetical protein